MASSEDPESKVKVDTHMRERRAWIKKLQYDFEGNFADFYNDDRVRIDYYKKNPPTFPDPSDGKYEHPCRLIAVSELSLEICGMLNHLHISPSTKHITNTLSKLQKKLTVSMIRMAIRGLNSAIIKHDSTL